MTVRWWRLGILYEEEGAPWTWTFHVRARTENKARALVTARVGRPHGVYACVASDPLLRVEQVEEIVAEAGPFRRSWNDSTVAGLRALLPERR